MKLGYRPDEAAAVVGSVQLFDEMRAAGWIRPVLSRRKLVLFDFAAVAACWARICKGEVPVAKTDTRANRTNGADRANGGAAV